MTTHRSRLILRWLVGIASTVLAGVMLTLLVWIGSTTVSNQVQQGRTAATTAAQIAALTQQVAELREDLAGVPQLRDRVSVLESHQQDLARRVSVLETERGR